MSETDLNNRLINWLAKESTESFLVEMIQMDKTEQMSKSATDADSDEKSPHVKHLFVSTGSVPLDTNDDLMSIAPHPLSPFSPSDISFPKHFPSSENETSKKLKHHQQIRQTLSPKSGSGSIDLEATPPLSPSSKTLETIISPRLRSDTLVSTSTSQRGSVVGQRPFADVKQFYFPHGIPLTPSGEQQEIDMITRLFSEHDNQLNVSQLKRVCIEICGLSSYCSGILFTKLVEFAKTIQHPPVTDSVSFELFVKFWSTFSKLRCPQSRLYALLHRTDEKQRGPESLPVFFTSNYLTREDFEPLIQYILDNHPGLEFLQSAPNFHRKYIRTVIERIFYEISGSGCDGITLNDLKRSNFTSVLNLLDIEEDINDVFDYFSYEHFYVIYCKFWELDTDHDAIIDENQLEKYAEYSLTRSVIRRIMDGIPRKLHGKVERTMTYEDFIPFIIAEEDKKNHVSVEYWFRVLDLDGDGVLSPWELKLFYDDQATRIRRISREVIDFRDYLCQLNDMIHPEKEGVFTLRDLKKSRLCHLFFNMLFNLNKFALHEQRDPYLIEEVRNTPQMTDWDRFASSEYARYVDEDVG